MFYQQLTAACTIRNWNLNGSDFLIGMRSIEDGQCRLERPPAISHNFRVYFDIECDRFPGMILQNENVPDAALVEGFEADIFPNAAARQARTPIPSETARLFAHVRAAFGFVRADPLVHRALAFALVHSWIRRVECDFNLIAAAGQCVLYVK